MDYDLSRVDYTICGITYPDTLKILLPSAPRTQQKFVVGDKNGVLQCLSIKDEEPIVQFKTLPGKPITSVQLASGYGTQMDKIFAASGNEVKGYTRKGKVFLTIETSVSETITSMCILGGDLILCSGKTVTCYRDLKEVNSYACDDRVLDIAAFVTPNSARIRLLAIIANKGAIVLENGRLVSHVAISSGPSRLAVPSSAQAAAIYAFYGAADGCLGLIVYEDSVLSNICLMEGHGLGSVVCMGWFYGNGGSHLAVGRHDGSIQLYLVDLENLSEKPRLKFTYALLLTPFSATLCARHPHGDLSMDAKSIVSSHEVFEFCGEPVTSVLGGCIGSEENELLASTFSGRIFALRSRRHVSVVGLANIPQDALALRRSKLETEILRLEKQTANEREKYQRSTRSLQAGLSAPPLLDIQCELLGATSDGWQEARITSAVPLDMLFMYCNRKLKILTDNTAVLSICSSQGTSEDLLATVGSWSQISISGSFSVAEINSWLTEVLPGDLPRPSTSINFARSHILIKSVLICRYQRGNAVFKSDNISTIAVIRDILSNCLIAKGIKVEMFCDIPDDCCLKSFIQLKEYFTAEYTKYKDFKLRDAISALDLDDKSINDVDPVLCEDYRRVCNTSNNDTKATIFQELVGIVLQWYADWQELSLHLKDYNTKQITLQNALQACNLDQIFHIFKNESAL